MLYFLSISDTSTAVEAEFGEVVDIVFLLDGSDSMRANEGLVLEFVQEFVKQLEIGPNKAQVALIQYSTEPSIEFVLSTYSLKEDVLNQLKNVKLIGGATANMGRAIDFAKNTVFTASSGSRSLQGVPQVLILASRQRSEDNVLGAVERLKNAGVALFGVGMKTADRVEMEQLAPGVWHFINQPLDIPLVRKEMYSEIASLKDIISPGVGESKDLSM